jgi:hypothetical protein
MRTKGDTSTSHARDLAAHLRSNQQTAQFGQLQPSLPHFLTNTLTAVVVLHAIPPIPKSSLSPETYSQLRHAEIVSAGAMV